MKKIQSLFYLSIIIVLRFTSIDSELLEHIDQIFSEQYNREVMPCHREYFRDQCLKYIEILEAEFGARPLSPIGQCLSSQDLRLNYQSVRSFFMRVPRAKGIEGLVQYELACRSKNLFHQRDFLANLFFLPLYKNNWKITEGLLMDLCCYCKKLEHILDFGKLQDLVQGLNYIVLILTFDKYSRKDAFSLLSLARRLCDSNHLFYQLSAIAMAIKRIIYISEFNDPDLLTDLQIVVKTQPESFSELMLQNIDPNFSNLCADTKTIFKFLGKDSALKKFNKNQIIARRQYLGSLGQSINR